LRPARWLEQDNFAVPARKMPTNGKTLSRRRTLNQPANNRKTKPELKRKAQRFALVAVGRARKMFGSRKNSKPEKCLKMPQNPHRPLHALLDPATIY